MDIRIINSKEEVINVTNKSIKKMGKWIVGVDEKGEIGVIEEYCGEEEAERGMKEIIEGLKIGTKKKVIGIIIELKREGKKRDEEK